MESDRSMNAETDHVIAALRPLVSALKFVVVSLLGIAGTCMADAGSGAGQPTLDAATPVSADAKKADTVQVKRAAAPRASSPLDRRVVLLARELDLDAAQQLRVKALLERQREQVAQVWQDESLPGALRVRRTQVISEGTEDGIRLLLTEEQKKRYFKPRTASVAGGGASADLATYMDKVNGR